MYENYGWYWRNGKSQQYVNGQWYDTPQQGNSSGGSGKSTADRLYEEAAGKESAYVDDLIAQAQGQRDLILKKLDAEHKLALGSDDRATAQFLETVADKLEERLGRIPYDYQRYTARELEDYAMGSEKIQSTKNLALEKLTNDQRLAENELKLSQGNDNQSLVERLNERGLLGTGKPQGMLQGQSLTGLDGIAGQTAGLQNTAYQQKYDALHSSNDITRRGITLDASQQQNELDFGHKNRISDITVDTRRDVQDQQQATTLGKEGAELEYEQRRREYERQRARLLQDARINADNKFKMGVY